MSPDVLRTAILYLIAFILCTSVHEFGHAWTATRLGDATPRAQGRLTLNPLHHIDPIGTVLMPFLVVLSAGATGGIPLLAWGRPVMTNPATFSRRFSRTTGRLLVSLSGPGMNLAMATAVSLVVLVGARTGLLSQLTALGLVKYLVSLNLWLMAFNLLPIPPLDGGAILEWVLPPSLQGISDFLRRWGFLILFAMLLTGRVFQVIMWPAIVLNDWWVRTLLMKAFA